MMIQREFGDTRHRYHHFVDGEPESSQRITLPQLENAEAKLGVICVLIISESLTDSS